MNPIDHYRQNGFQFIEGWCSEAIFDVIKVLDDAGINRSGGVLEIGIHHGKLFLLLNQTVLPDFKSYAIDVFDDQHLNIDNSGGGSLSIFQNNLKNFDLYQGDNTIIIKGDSLDSALDLCNTIGRGSIKFLSIDGGHTVEHTMSDLRLASDLIKNTGVVLLDDILHPNWLGVIEGAVKFLNTNPTLVPFAIGHGKLFLSRLSFRDYYFNLLSGSVLSTNTVKFFGWNLVVL